MTNKPPQLDIIIVSYNTAELTLRAIRSVYEQTINTSFNLIVVDNDSKDESADRIASEFPELALIRSTVNTGFSGGNNLGAKYPSKESRADHILLLNPDTVVLDSAIDKLYAFAQKNPNNGLWGGITLNNDLSINANNAWSKPGTLTLLFSALGISKVFSNSCFFNKANYGCWKRDTELEVDIIQGCFFLSKRSLWDKLGGLDESFFMYGEEADYCLKAINLGFQPIITPDAKIIHHGGASETTFSGKMIKLLKGKVELVHRHSKSWEQPIHKALLQLYIINKVVSSKLRSLLNSSNKNSDKSNKKYQAQEWARVMQAQSSWLQGWQISNDTIIDTIGKSTEDKNAKEKRRVQKNTEGKKS